MSTREELAHQLPVLGVWAGLALVGGFLLWSQPFRARWREGVAALRRRPVGAFELILVGSYLLVFFFLPRLATMASSPAAPPAEAPAAATALVELAQSGAEGSEAAPQPAAEPEAVDVAGNTDTKTLSNRNARIAAIVMTMVVNSLGIGVCLVFALVPSLAAPLSASGPDPPRRPSLYGFLPRGRPAHGFLWIAVATSAFFLIAYFFCGAALFSYRWIATYFLEEGQTVVEQEVVTSVREAASDSLVSTLNVVLAVVFAPLMEELAFRGVLLAGLARRLGAPVAIVVTSLLFGLIHFNEASFLPLSLLGAGFACAYIYTRTIWAPILMHAVFNALNVLQLLRGG